MMRKWLVVALLGMLVMGATSATATPVRVNVPDAEETHRESVETAQDTWNETFLAAMAEIYPAVALVANATGLSELESLFLVMQQDITHYESTLAEHAFETVRAGQWDYVRTCKIANVGVKTSPPYYGYALYPECLPIPVGVGPL
ncbi:MAG: hypothetical protein ACPHID_06430 [Thermoplasmatota archaeon]